MYNLQQIKTKYGIIGNHSNFNLVLEVALQVAPTDLSILINGESGVGKEVFSKIIHQHSLRKHEPFIAINCGALPEGTIDAELFGHEKGAFTGAIESRKGYFETVNGGTIFLDEIGEMPLGTQARLLRLLESGEFIKVGSSKILKTNVRVIAATNKNLIDAIKEKTFREDLYYRLSTIPINIPALKDRTEDIPLLIKKFANDFATKYNTKPIQLNPDALKLLTEYPFPGNIRELKNITEQLSILSENKIITTDTIEKLQILKNYKNTLIAKDNKSAGQDFVQQEKEMIYKWLYELKKEILDIKTTIINLAEHNNLIIPNAEETQTTIQKIPLLSRDEKIYNNNTTIKQLPATTTIIDNNYTPTNLNLIEQEKEFIIKALDKHKGKKRRAASELGISERTLYRKLKEFNIPN